ncbi:DNA topoisomerase 1-like [Diabrotica virgifera virgifera]|uniref:Uncharacterized protein n=1 Tax=Diabrotica virgifera virgifera TaxID=50390 RepID=A0ABM5KYA3_DIAVI|nr:DNA topoisomerase 1-like [Diabrotica virgifera virgifera]
MNTKKIDMHRPLTQRELEAELQLRLEEIWQDESDNNSDKSESGSETEDVVLEAFSPSESEFEPPSENDSDSDHDLPSTSKKRKRSSKKSNGLKKHFTSVFPGKESNGSKIDKEKTCPVQKTPPNEEESLEIAAKEKQTKRKEETEDDVLEEFSPSESEFEPSSENDSDSDHDLPSTSKKRKRSSKKSNGLEKEFTSVFPRKDNNYSKIDKEKKCPAQQTPPKEEESPDIAAKEKQTRLPSSLKGKNGHRWSSQPKAATKTPKRNFVHFVQGPTDKFWNMFVEQF